MPTLDQRIAFCTKHVRNKAGRPFSLVGRQWVIDEFWKPLNGWRLWPKSPEALCDACKETMGEIVDWSPRHSSATQRHFAATDGCMGLEYKAIVVTAIKVKRQRGKTFNFASFTLPDLCMTRGFSCAYMATAKDQTALLLDENWMPMIEQDPVLRSKLHRVGSKITCASTRSTLEILSSAHGSITGRGRRLIGIDEARDVNARTAMALLPSIFAQQGIECPRGHVQHPPNYTGPKTCPHCKSRLVPWQGRIAIFSAAGIIDEGSDRTWFSELVEKLRAEPDPAYHLFEGDDSVSSDLNLEGAGALERVFGQLPSTRTYIDVEANNEFRQKGEDFISGPELDAACTQPLGNLEGSARRCVGFLDTSISHDLTNLVLLEEAAGEGEALGPWERLAQVRIDIWDPKTSRSGTIDPEAIFAHLQWLLGRFPAIEVLAVDVRLMPWAVALVERCSRQPWGRRVEAFTGGSAERNAGWNMLEQRILTRTIALQPHPTQLAELRAVKRVDRLDGSTEVRDRSRKRRHADVAETVASCCYLAHLQALKTRSASLGEVRQASHRSSVLERLFRPVTTGLGENSF